MLFCTYCRSLTDHLLIIVNFQADAFMESPKRRKIENEEEEEEDVPGPSISEAAPTQIKKKGA